MPSDRKIMFVIFSALTGTAMYQLFITPDSQLNSKLVVQPTAYGPSIAVVDCQDCLETVGETCEMEIDSCGASQSCEQWALCTEECVASGDTENCYTECDLAHSDIHSECSALKSCMCDVCIGQCVDMCMADG